DEVEIPVGVVILDSRLKCSRKRWPQSVASRISRLYRKSHIVRGRIGKIKCSVRPGLDDAKGCSTWTKCQSRPGHFLAGQKDKCKGAAMERTRRNSGLHGERETTPRSHGEYRGVNSRFLCRRCQYA